MSKLDPTGVHRTHCCAFHGCKYGDSECAVEFGNVRQEYPCESCDYSLHLDPRELVWDNGKFLQYTELTIADIPKILEEAKVYVGKPACDLTSGMDAYYKLTKEPKWRAQSQLLCCAMGYALRIQRDLFNLK